MKYSKNYGYMQGYQNNILTTKQNDKDKKTDKKSLKGVPIYF